MVALFKDSRYMGPPLANAIGQLMHEQKTKEKLKTYRAKMGYKQRE
jgi:hypothetical protein